MSEERKHENNEISLNELIQKIQDLIGYLKTQWWKITIACLLGVVTGFLYAYVQPVTYTAKTTFVVEDAKSGGGLSGLASLAGQFGVDLSSNAGGELISGENILLYFKSESIVRDVLLSNWDNKKSFADRYIELYNIRENIIKNNNLKDFNLPIKSTFQEYSRLQDSVIQQLSIRIIKSELNITRPDKKAGFIELSTTMENEEFSKRFNDQLLKSAIDKYVGLKTERQKKTVQRLQERADSIANLLNVKTSASASLQTMASTMDVNPLYRTSSSITTELNLRDKTMLVAIYVEVVKNLEMAKFTLNQETPVIQIVNDSKFPLIKNRQSQVKTGIIFGFLFTILLILILIFKRVFNRQISVKFS